MEDVKITRIDPIVFGERDLQQLSALYELGYRLGDLFQCRTMTREELERLYDV